VKRSCAFEKGAKEILSRAERQGGIEVEDQAISMVHEQSREAEARGARWPGLCLPGR
jgi:hypothetical protein